MVREEEVGVRKQAAAPRRIRHSPRIIQRKENAAEFDYSSFYAKTGAGDPLVCGGGLAFLMTFPRTAAHEETELLSR